MTYFKELAYVIAEVLFKSAGVIRTSREEEQSKGNDTLMAEFISAWNMVAFAQLIGPIVLVAFMSQ